MKPTTYKTHKAAREAGLRTAEEWLVEERLSNEKTRKAVIPCLKAKGLLVKGKAFFSADQCEEVISAKAAKERGLSVRAEAEPVRSFHGRFGDYSGFRISDCVPEQERSGIAVRDLLSIKDLGARGWTDAMITRFLGESDETATNPRYVTKSPMRLFRLNRVEAVEKQPNFQSALVQSASRRERAKRAAAKRREQTLAQVETISISVPHYTRKELVRRACEHYNSGDSGREHEDCASPGSSSEFLERITVNYLRHQTTQYDEHLRQLFGKVGKADAHALLKERVLDSIAEEYPWLCKECWRQLDKFWKEQEYRL